MSVSGCGYPDPSFHFEGMTFGGLGGETIISGACSEYVNMACEQCVRLCPDDSNSVGEILKERLI